MVGKWPLKLVVIMVYMVVGRGMSFKTIGVEE